MPVEVRHTAYQFERKSTHPISDVGLKVLLSGDIDTNTSIFEILGRDFVRLAGHSRDDHVGNGQAFGKRHGRRRGHVMRVGFGGCSR